MPQTFGHKVDQDVCGEPCAIAANRLLVVAGAPTWCFAMFCCDRKRSLQRSMQTWVAQGCAPWVRLRLWRVEARVLAVWNHVTAFHFAIVSFRLITSQCFSLNNWKNKATKKWCRNSFEMKAQDTPYNFFDERLTKQLPGADDCLANIDEWASVLVVHLSWGVWRKMMRNIRSLGIMFKVSSDRLNRIVE